MGGGVALLAFLGGTWFPLTAHSALYTIAQFIPSYWLVQASHVALGGRAWTAQGWLVIAGWTLALVVLARRAYRRDTARAS